MKFLKLFLNKKFLVTFCIVLSVLIMIIAPLSIMVPSYMSYKEYYDNIIAEREHEKYLQSLPLEFLGISAELKDGVEYYDNGRSYPGVDDFNVTAHFTEKGRDFDEKIRTGSYEIDVPDDFAENGGNVRVSYTYTPDGEDAEPITKETNVVISLVPVKLVSLDVTERPYRVAYKAGMTFDAEGMSAEAVYNDGTVLSLGSGDITVKTTGALAANTPSAEISYDDGETEVTATVPIDVKSEEEYTDGEILSIASDGECYVPEGSALADADPVIRATYSNGNRLILDESEYSVAGNIDTATFMKNCILTVSLTDGSGVSSRVPVGVRNGIEAENATVTKRTPSTAMSSRTGNTYPRVRPRS